ncbi:hypothetical protein A5821_001538 [Enterococcus sp. 7F3_DIV0205]|uniref:AraC effector-binding domain-containing protein n=1 Tax=Candidatus Enterococcus palustris TaxID=1834189 RepID=A0AAQ3WDH7_9ENTE|nr:GyrI-like domain-containing protein [Enterococcus sp. 7F3_DIV0205]OTN85934.1 hypothetical protein A5821_001883 [Enterococcus sp. 7F3_DIV0205]
MKIEIIPIQRIFYLRRIGCYGEENKQLMATLKEKLKEASLFNEDTIIYGIAWSELNTPKEMCIYDVCVTVSAEQNIIEEMKETVLEGGKYAIFKIKHTEKEIQRFWEKFMQQNFQKEIVIIADLNRPILERYTGRLIAAGYCEFCVPIE